MGTKKEHIRVWVFVNVPGFGCGGAVVWVWGSGAHECAPYGGMVTGVMNFLLRCWFCLLRGIRALAFAGDAHPVLHWLRFLGAGGWNGGAKRLR